MLIAPISVRVLGYFQYREGHAFDKYLILSYYIFTFLGVNMYINDREWLDRMKLAAEHFERSNEATKEAVDAFIRWTYALYGVVLPEDRKGEKK